MEKPNNPIDLKQHNRVWVQNIEVWSHEQPPFKAHLLIENGTLISLQRADEKTSVYQEQKPKTTLIDGAGQILIPAGVDPQVHLRVPGQEHKEDALSGLSAAVAGGFGAVLSMPNTKPVIDQVAVVDLARSLLAPASKELGVHVEISAAISMNQKSKQAVDFKQLRKNGVCAFTDDGVGVTNEPIMREAFAASEKYGFPILQHAEIPGHGGVLAAGPVQNKLGIKVYPKEVEWQMVERDLKILQDYPKARYHVLHVSCRESVDLIQEAKKKSLNVTCEVSPHHLLFCNEDIDETKSSFKMNPPLRSKSDQEYLRSALADRRIDFVATDHAPHEPNIKTSNFKTSAFGTTGLGASLRVLLTMWANQEIDTQRLVEVFSFAPAIFLSLDSSFGQFKEGQKFRGAFVSKHKISTPYLENQSHSKSKNSCFFGASLNGFIDKVILGKNTIELH